VRIQRLGLALMKGARHEELPALDLTASGPAGDRELCLVDLGRRRVVRTVEHPELMQVRVRRDGGDLVVETPDGVTRGSTRPTGEAVACDYWGRRPDLELLHGPHAAALADFLGMPVALARARPGEVVYGAPLTVVTTTDVAELGRRAGVPDLAAQSARFRATLVLDDDDDADAAGGPLPRDPTGTRLRVGDAVVELTGPIPRCAVIDSDPSTGRKDIALLATLAGYRRVAGEIWFGHYARVVSAGRCHAGDSVERHSGGA
jgi:uncharacterized protein YcbX